MSFFTKAVALAAHDIPAVNARIDGDEIVYHNYLDVSVAVSAPNGLVVPVVRNADSMSFADIEKAIADLGKRAKDRSAERPVGQEGGSKCKSRGSQAPSK